MREEESDTEFHFEKEFPFLFLQRGLVVVFDFVCLISPLASSHLILQVRQLSASHI